MQRSYEEGIANHFVPESCMYSRKGVGEALTGVRVGWVLSRESNVNRGADAVNLSGMPHRTGRYRKTCPDPARSETPCMRWNISHENREIPCLSAREGCADRIKKSTDAR